MYISNKIHILRSKSLRENLEVVYRDKFRGAFDAFLGGKSRPRAKWEISRDFRVRVVVGATRVDCRIAN